MTDEFTETFKTLPRHQKKRILKSIKHIPETVEEFWKSCQSLNKGFEEARRDLLQEAGWDPTGWILQDWATLPNLMKRDFNKIWPSFKDIIRSETEKLRKELENNKVHAPR